MSTTIIRYYHQQGQTVRQIARATGYPAHIVRKLVRNPEDRQAREWIQRHRAPTMAQPRREESPSVASREPHAPLSHRMHIVSLDHVEAYLDQLITSDLMTELPPEHTIESLMLAEGQRLYGRTAGRGLTSGTTADLSGMTGAGPVVKRDLSTDDELRYQEWIRSGQLVQSRHRPHT